MNYCFNWFQQFQNRLQLRLKNQRRLFSPGAIALLLLSSACQPGNNSNPNVLKIGTLLPITGDLAQIGATMQDSVTLLVEQANQCEGVLGQPIQLISEDDQTEPAAGASAMSKLAEVDRIGAVIGGASSAVSSAAVDIAVRNQIVEISPSSTSPIFTERAKQGDFNGYWFRTAPADTLQGQALAQLAQQKKLKTVAIIAINNDYGRGLADSFNTAFQAVGGQVVQQERFDPQSSTFDSEVSAAFNGNPDAVLLIAYPETGSLILKTAYQQGVLNKQTQLIVSEGMKLPELANLVGKNSAGEYIAAGIIGTAPSAGGPGLATFNQLYTTKYNRQPNVYDPNSWDAAALIVLAAEAAKSPTGVAIKDQIRAVANPPGEEVTDICQALTLIRQSQEINYQGASGPVDLDEQGDVPGSYDLWTIDSDGKIKVTGTITVGGS